MTDRWRGRAGGLAIPVLLAATALMVALPGVRGADGPVLLVRLPDDRVVAEVPLPYGEFALRYRNSLYRSTAEERFAIDTQGRLVLVGLAADELAVLEEYYAIAEPAERTPGDSCAWRAVPGNDVMLGELIVAATDLGRRTLLVDGRRPLELWRLVDDGSPSVTLEVRMP
jgi:hypothetical protein